MKKIFMTSHKKSSFDVLKRYSNDDIFEGDIEDESEDSHQLLLTQMVFLDGSGLYVFGPKMKIIKNDFRCRKNITTYQCSPVAHYKRVILSSEEKSNIQVSDESRRRVSFDRRVKVCRFNPRKSSLQCRGKEKRKTQKPKTSLFISNY